MNDLKDICNIVEKAILRGKSLANADLRGAYLIEADLSRANLNRANLSGAYLSGADLSGANGIIAIGPIGGRDDFVYFVQHANCIMVKTGYFWGNMDEFLSAVDKTHGDAKHGRAYRAACDLAKIVLEA